MSDEMVQETTETAIAVAPEGIQTETPSDEHSSPVPAVSTVAAVSAATEEPAPAQPVAPEKAFATNAPMPSAGSDSGMFEEAMKNFDAEFKQSLQQLQQDTVVLGTVMRIDRGEVLVDVGAKSEGIIRLNELSRAGSNVTPESVVSVGEKIKVYVLEAENQDGVPILSKKRADFESAWDKVQISKETGETIKAIVTDRVKGGLVVDLGIRGFVPASHVGSGSLRNNLEKYLGQEIMLKVIEVDKERHKVVLSNKLAVSEERDAKSAETKASLTPGQTRRGTVRRLTAYGAFIDLGGIDGLLHISEMSWTRIKDPKEILREGQELDVHILKTDLESNRVSLGLRQILPDPWPEISKLFKEGDVITGTVTRIHSFGVFVQVEGGVEGIIPTGEMPRNKSGKGGPGVNVDEEVTVKVIGLQPENRKMTLSLRALQPAEDQGPPSREPSAAPAANGAAPAAGGAASAPAAGGRVRRGREDDRGEREEFPRYRPDQEPRFTIGDAFAAAKKNEKTRRERRNNELEDEEIDLNSIEVDDTEAETTTEPEEAPDATGGEAKA